jgi:hypothetical protein
LKSLSAPADANGQLVLLASVFWTLGIPVLYAASLSTGSRSFLHIFYAVTLFFVLVAFLRAVAGRAVSLPAGLVASYGLFLLVLGVATLRAQLFLPFSPDVDQFRSLLSLALWTVVMLLVPQFIRSAGEIKILLKLSDFAGLAIAATVFIAFAGLDFGETLSSDGGRRAFGPLGDQVGFVLSFFAVREIVLRHWLRFAYFSLAIMATGTRGALGVALLGVVLAIALETHRSKGGGSTVHRKSRLVALVLVVLMLVLLFTTPLATFFLERLTNPEFIGATALQRFGAMSLAMDLVADYPWLGVGFHGYSGAAWSYSPLYYFPVALEPSILEIFIVTASNQYLQTLTDGGVFALAFLGCLVLSAIAVLVRARRACRDELRGDATALLCWSIALPVGNQTACWLLPESLIGYLWFFCIGAGLAVLSAATTNTRRVRAAASNSGTVAQSSLGAVLPPGTSSR